MIIIAVIFGPYHTIFCNHEWSGPINGQMVETLKARARLESALRDRKIAISLKRLIDGDPKQEKV